MNMKKWMVLALLLLVLTPIAALGETMNVRNPVATDRLHLRVSPKKGAGSLGRFYNGTTVEVLARENGFCRVRIGAGDGAIDGWMSADFLTPEEVSPALPAAFVYGDASDGSVPVRSTPDGTRIGTLYDGMICNILGDIGEEAVYIHHVASDTYGYLSTSDIVRLPADRRNTYDGIDGCILRSDGDLTPVHLRAAPDSGARSLGRFYVGTSVNVLAESGDWALVQMCTPGTELFGYMRARFIKKQHFDVVRSSFMTLTRDVSVLCKGDAAAPALGTLLKGARVLPIALMGDYAQLTLSEELIGYVPLDALQPLDAFYASSEDRIAGAQGLCVVAAPGARDDDLIPAYATCDAFYPLSRVNTGLAYAPGFQQGDGLIVLAQLGAWTQVYDGYSASFMPTDCLHIFATGPIRRASMRYDAGTYVAGQDIPAGFYTYWLFDSAAQGRVRIEYENGLVREYAPRGQAMYSFYLPENARVTTDEIGSLTTMDTTQVQSPFSRGLQSGRILVGASMNVDACWVKPLEGADESWFAITTLEDDLLGREVVRIPVQPTTADVEAQQSFFAPAGCFIEFSGCVFGANG